MSLCSVVYVSVDHRLDNVLLSFVMTAYIKGGRPDPPVAGSHAAVDVNWTFQCHVGSGTFSRFTVFFFVFFLFFPTSLCSVNNARVYPVTAGSTSNSRRDLQFTLKHVFGHAPLATC